MLPPKTGLGRLGPSRHFPVRGLKISTVSRTFLTPARVTPPTTTTSTSPMGDTRLVQEWPALAWIMLVAGRSPSSVRYQLDLEMFAMEEAVEPPAIKVWELFSWTAQ